ncbi:MAG: hypothetical protein OXH39_08535 [Candidatus Poribacteria bacterium]|nr:hypothetical protein [Candidatus Poribacteria bacterium]
MGNLQRKGFARTISTGSDSSWEIFKEPINSSKHTDISKDKWGEFNTNSSKGVIDALIDIGRMMESHYGDNNTGNMEALNDLIDDTIGSGALAPEEYMDKYYQENGRLQGYTHTMALIRALACIKYW